MLKLTRFKFSIMYMYYIDYYYTHTCIYMSMLGVLIMTITSTQIIMYLSYSIFKCIVICIQFEDSTCTVYFPLGMYMRTYCITCTCTCICVKHLSQRPNHSGLTHQVINQERVVRQATQSLARCRSSGVRYLLIWAATCYYF